MYDRVPRYFVRQQSLLLVIHRLSSIAPVECFDAVVDGPQRRKVCLAAGVDNTATLRQSPEESRPLKDLA